jgi:hypothetical protein
LTYLRGVLANDQARRHRSIAELTEKELVDLVFQSFGDPARYDWLSSAVLNVRGIPSNPEVRKEVDLRGLSGRPLGDVDVLLWPSGKPNEAVAIQIKRFNATIDGSRDRLHGLRRFEKGVRQANLNAKLGFSLVFLWVFVTVDSRTVNPNTGGFTYVGLPPDLAREIRDTISTKGLDARVGLVAYEFVQSMDHAPYDMGSFESHLKQQATSVEQSADVTAWIQALK